MEQCIFIFMPLEAKLNVFSVFLRISGSVYFSFKDMWLFNFFVHLKVIKTNYYQFHSQQDV